MGGLAGTAAPWRNGNHAGGRRGLTPTLWRASTSRQFPEHARRRSPTAVEHGPCRESASSRPRECSRISTGYWRSQSLTAPPVPIISIIYAFHLLQPFNRIIVPQSNDQSNDRIRFSARGSADRLQIVQRIEYFRHSIVCTCLFKGIEIEISQLRNLIYLSLCSL